MRCSTDQGCAWSASLLRRLLANLPTSHSRLRPARRVSLELPDAYRWYFLTRFHEGVVGCIRQPASDSPTHLPARRFARRLDRRHAPSAKSGRGAGGNRKLKHESGLTLPEHVGIVRIFAILRQLIAVNAHLDFGLRIHALLLKG